MAEERYYATGKRKTAVARVWMVPGSGKIIINKKPLMEYLVRESDRLHLVEPLKVTDTANKFDMNVNVKGGGIFGQAGAIRHGISRVLVISNPEFRGILKKHGFLTRDSRMKERKKYGRLGARARYQYSKR
ncbi:MAG: 30S ribosomal protein S9 [Desulfobacteraceae bacterium 4484_190.1]|nr:MAG: 30S ribosomal protein S9 [Desulfobacteraceae bacterium 4484_190.1]